MNICTDTARQSAYNISSGVFFASGVALTVLGGLGLAGIISGLSFTGSSIGLGVINIAAVGVATLTDGEKGKRWTAILLLIVPLACTILGILCMHGYISAALLGGVMVAPAIGLAIMLCTNHYCCNTSPAQGKTA